MSETIRKVWMKILIVEIVIIEVLYLGGAVFFSNHFFLNTAINGINVSMMTAEQAQQVINETVEDYQLELRERNGEVETINGANINLKYEFKNSTKEIMNQQNLFLWFVSVFRKKEYMLDSSVTYDDELLQGQIRNLACMQSENIIKPKELQIIRKDNEFIVQEGIEGNQVLFQRFYMMVRENISTLMTYMDLEQEECYVAPRYNKDD